VAHQGRAQPAECGPKIPLLCDRPEQTMPMTTRSVALPMPAGVIGGVSLGPGTLSCSGPEPATTGILSSHLGHQAELEVILII